MTKNAKKLFAVSVAVLSTVMPLLTATISPAEAFIRRSCRNVYLTVQNETGEKIRVIDLDYWDPSSELWRSEPVSNETIPNGQPWQETRNLEKVDQMETKVRVKYRTLKDNGKWSWKISKQNSRSAVCKKNGSYIITLK